MRNAGTRLVAFAQNATEVARYGGLRTEDETFPYAIEAQWKDVVLRRYFPEEPASGPAFLLVHPLMMSAEMWDVAPAVSCVRKLYESGIDPWVIDYGRPETTPEILERTLSDLVVALDRAVEHICTFRGSDVFVGGYSQGGMLGYQVAAYRSTKGVAGVVSFGAPVDFRGGLPSSVSPEVIAKAGKVLGSVGSRVSVPGWLTRNAFRVVDPVKATRKQVDFLLALHDRDALLPREGQRRFIDGDGWLTAPGPALAEFAHQFLEHNRMLQGGIVVNGVALSLADITCPMLAVIGDSDIVASAGTIRPLKDAAPNSDTWEAHVTAGHLGLVLGSRAQAQGWPAVIEFVHWADGNGPEPSLARRIADVEERGVPDIPHVPREPGTRLLLKQVASSTADAGRNLRRTLESASVQARRLARVQSSGSVRESLALTLDEQAAKNPTHIQFLYQGTAVTRADAKMRIDAVTRGLLHIGVHQGDHVGILMGARPSAVSAVAAVNRIGAVSVMLRPGFEVEREASLGATKLVICDPERVHEALSTGRPVYVLGGGNATRPTLPAGVMDLERLDVETTRVPSWFEENPGRSPELAFVMFTGEKASLRAHHVTNHRWVLSAFGTAAAAALSERDTVYCLTPPSHMSGLLVSIGAAIAGDARFAMADAFDPDVFWEEVRRYGVTVVSYTWSSLQALVDAPPRKTEDNHPIRLFVGSGMPPALWRRVAARFKPAGVVGFYTSPGEAVLVNLGGTKPGALGRPLPGASKVRLVAWDLTADEPMRDEDGWPILCGVNEPGMLLAEVTPDGTCAGVVPDVVRGVLQQGDAWLASGDLVVRDAEGDFWWHGSTRQIVQCASGLRYPSMIRDALETMNAVEVAVAFPVEDSDGNVVAAAAVQLRTGARLTAADLARAFDEADESSIPDLVRVVSEVPKTYLYRPVPGQLADEGLVSATTSAPVWRRQGSMKVFKPA